MPSHDEPHDTPHDEANDEVHPDRNETFTERMDRNWNELLQELRVTQTGTQILTGFLFTIPFQQRFADLDAYQKDLYLVLVVLAVLATALIVAPVSLHRVLFRRGLKPQLVAAADVFARAGLVVLALVLSGGAMLLFDVVSTREVGWVVGGVSLAVLTAAWWLVPRLIARSAKG